MREAIENQVGQELRTRFNFYYLRKFLRLQYEDPQFEILTNYEAAKVQGDRKAQTSQNSQHVKRQRQAACEKVAQKLSAHLAAATAETQGPTFPDLPQLIGVASHEAVPPSYKFGELFDYSKGLEMLNGPKPLTREAKRLALLRPSAGIFGALRALVQRFTDFKGVARYVIYSKIAESAQKESGAAKLVLNTSQKVGPDFRPLAFLRKFAPAALRAATDPDEGEGLKRFAELVGRVQKKAPEEWARVAWKDKGNAQAYYKRLRTILAEHPDFFREVWQSELNKVNAHRVDAEQIKDEQGNPYPHTTNLAEYIAKGFRECAEVFYEIGKDREVVANKMTPKKAATLLDALKW